MPGLQTTLSDLNRAFGRDNIKDLVARREAFAPGKPFAAGVVVKEGTALHKAWTDYLNIMPKGIQVAQQAVIYYALGTSPPTRITFAWAPGYDWELTIWQAPDTDTTPGGITILTKSRYPGDKHPLSRG
jgi:hypothetical protein